MAEANVPGRGQLGPSKPERRSSRRPLVLPREHGFWAMLIAVTASALLKSRAAPEVLAASVLVVGAATLGGMWFGRSIRRDSSAQVVSSAALGMLSVPLDLAAGRALGPALVTSAVWVSVFAASALGVRAIFARASSRSRRFSPWLSSAAVLLPAAAALFCYFADAPTEVGAALFATIVLGALVLIRPSVKSLKPVGIALAALHGVCAVILAAAGP